MNFDVNTFQGLVAAQKIDIAWDNGAIQGLHWMCSVILFEAFSRTVDSVELLFSARLC
jgi:hypothetical protein